jgi:hypothetical protein
MADLKDVDAFERAQLIRVVLWFGPACFLMLSLLWSFLRQQGVIATWVFVVLLVLTPVFTAGGVLAIHHGTSSASAGLVKTLYAAGDIAPPRTYPRQDGARARAGRRRPSTSGTISRSSRPTMKPG